MPKKKTRFRVATVNELQAKESVEFIESQINIGILENWLWSLDDTFKKGVCFIFAKDLIQSESVGINKPAITFKDGHFLSMNSYT